MLCFFGIYFVSDIFFFLNVILSFKNLNPEIPILTKVNAKLMKTVKTNIPEMIQPKFRRRFKFLSNPSSSSGGT
jgi:hypothetical protein